MCLSPRNTTYQSINHPESNQFLSRDLCAKDHSKFVLTVLEHAPALDIAEICETVSSPRHSSQPKPSAAASTPSDAAFEAHRQDRRLHYKSSTDVVRQVIASSDLCSLQLIAAYKKYHLSPAALTCAAQSPPVDKSEGTRLECYTPETTIGQPDAVSQQATGATQLISSEKHPPATTTATDKQQLAAVRTIYRRRLEDCQQERMKAEAAMQNEREKSTRLKEQLSSRGGCHA